MQNHCFKLDKYQKAIVDKKLKELLEICQIHQIPMFATVAVENDDNHTVYDNITYSYPARNMELSDDQIIGHILISNGFHAVPPREDVTIDMSDIIGKF